MTQAGLVGVSVGEFVAVSLVLLVEKQTSFLMVHQIKALMWVVVENYLKIFVLNRIESICCANRFTYFQLRSVLLNSFVDFLYETMSFSMFH